MKPCRCGGFDHQKTSSKCPLNKNKQTFISFSSSSAAAALIKCIDGHLTHFVAKTDEQGEKGDWCPICKKLTLEVEVASVQPNLQKPSVPTNCDEQKEENKKRKREEKKKMK